MLHDTFYYIKYQHYYYVCSCSLYVNTIHVCMFTYISEVLINTAQPSLIPAERTKKTEILTPENKQTKIERNFKYVGFLIKKQNSTPEEIKEHLLTGKGAYFAWQNVFNSKTVS